MAPRRVFVNNRPRRRAAFTATGVSLLMLACGATQAVDLIGNGLTDVLWRLPAGNPLIWEMSGLSLQAQITVPTALGAGSTIVDTGKFFGSDNADAIAWISSNDQLTLWQIGNDGSIRQSCTVASSIDPDLDFIGIGDIDANGSDDVLWRNRTDGSVSAFLMDGCNPPRMLTLQATADSAWTLGGAGDVNGDGLTDLLWRDGTTNTIIEWLVDPDGAITQQVLLEGEQANWRIEAIGDFGGDGKADLLWRDPESQSLVIWRADGDGTFDPVLVEPASSSTFATADDIFGNGFDTGVSAAPALDDTWTILGAADFDDDGSSDLLLANDRGNTAIWLMQGTTVRTTGLFLPTSADMPLAGITGWRLPLDRPVITKASNQVSVAWDVLSGNPSYVLYGSASNDPANTGSIVSTALPPLSFARSDPGFASTDRYFSVSASYHGLQLPPSKEAYIVEFALTDLRYWGAMSIADFNNDGCQDLLGALGDCHGNFQSHAEQQMGLSALRVPDRAYRDVRFADFNGDGILDAIANVYSCDSDGCGGNEETSQILLFFGNADGTFTESDGFSSMNMGGGFGETIVIADFNNDGYLDIFLPKYTAYSSDEHDFLLINDGHGNFTDIADAAGVAMRNISLGYRPEGAQALDINDDGLIDLYVASHLFINNGNLTFTNVGVETDLAGVVSISPWGLPAQFDEGAKFIDWDNSGQLALALNTVYDIRVFKYDGLQHFTEQAVIPPIYMNTSYGLEAMDVDGDGRDDIAVAGGFDQAVETDPSYGKLKAELDEDRKDSQSSPYNPIRFELEKEHEHDPDEAASPEDVITPNARPQLLVNRGNFVLHDFYDDGLQPSQRGWSDLLSYADFDYSGTSDVAARVGPDEYILANQANSNNAIVITVLGKNGAQNQQGRIVRVTPNAHPNVTMTRVVDSGSGYMANGPYDLTFATPYFGAYTVSVRFAEATYTTVARSGDHVTLYANGTYSVEPRR
jgi:hypothetical protein